MRQNHGQRGFSLMELMIVVGLIGVISAIAAPMIVNAMANFRLSGDARGVANSTAVVKMRSASDFSRVRLYVELAAKKYHLETLNKTTHVWSTEGGDTYLSYGVSFSSGALLSAPPNTQGTIGQAPLCKDNAGADVAGTACIIFNSRGIPIDSSVAGNPTNADALYITDGTAVYGVTVSATGMIRSWRAQPSATASWVAQ